MNGEYFSIDGVAEPSTYHVPLLESYGSIYRLRVLVIEGIFQPVAT